MKAEQVEMIARIGGLAVETLLEYLRLPPADEAGAVAQDQACLALMAQQQRIADALRGRLGVPEAEDRPPDQVRGQRTDVREGGLAEAPAAAPLTSDIRYPTSGIDLAFLARLEGDTPEGYVPARRGVPIGQSGVTVGMGVDLGRRTAGDLGRLGLSAALINRLHPYLGKRRQAAQQALAAQPLRLSDDECRQLSLAVLGEFLGRLARRYDAAAPKDAPSQPFAALPAAAQTVIASVAWQYGADLARACPIFWSLVIRQNWAGAAAELENFGDDYGSRRRKEAKLLRTLLA